MALNNNQQPYSKFLDEINQEIEDMQEAERQMLANGLTLADYSLPVATRTIRNQRMERERTLPPEKGFDRFESVMPSGESFQGTTPGKPEPLSKPITEPKKIGTQYDIPKHLQGTYAKDEVPFQKNLKDKEGNVYNERLVKIPRKFKGQDVFLLKEDESLKKMPWAKTAEVNGKKVWYTEERNLPGAVYKRDILKEYQNPAKGNEITYAHREFGDLPTATEDIIDIED
jgi:hypothetical protein